MHPSNTIVNGNLSDDNFKSSLISKAKTLMQKLDNCPVSCRWKLKLYQNGIFPRLSWYLSLLPLSPSWLQSELDRIVTSYLKKWCKLRRSACTAIFYLLPQNAGLGLPVCLRLPSPSSLRNLPVSYPHMTTVSALWPPVKHIINRIATDSLLLEKQQSHYLKHQVLLQQN